MLVFDKKVKPQSPPQGMVTLDVLQRHASDIDFFLNNVPTKSNAIIELATNSTNVIVRLNELITALKAVGVVK